MKLLCDVLSVQILRIIEKEKCILGTWFYALVVVHIYVTFIYVF